ncbi:Xenotropic and polytropic retrovirus receptor 1 [Cichlidogyrus casuarinus]|uniref:Xenotropic and polytropic retrovirus receptor 1 n=1 Tax=Cichlidogyrus casuarinus TaxID=1844966 RepID=A0ABD2PQ67_9PLAT
MLVITILACLLNTAYCYYWDIFCDWSLVDRNCSSRLKRDELIYRFKAYYVVAAIEDLLIRLNWAIILWLTYTEYRALELIKFGGALLEVIRRFIWNFFRLENEHLNNCGQFRAVRDINIARLPKPEAPKTVLKQKIITTLKNAHTLKRPSMRNIQSANDLVGMRLGKPRLMNKLIWRSRKLLETIPSDMRRMNRANSIIAPEEFLPIVEFKVSPQTTNLTVHTLQQARELYDIKSFSPIEEDDSPGTTQIPEQARKMAQHLRSILKKDSEPVSTSDDSKIRRSSSHEKLKVGPSPLAMTKEEEETEEAIKFFVPQVVVQDGSPPTRSAITSL